MVERVLVHSAKRVFVVELYIGDERLSTCPYV